MNTNLVSVLYIHVQVYTVKYKTSIHSVLVCRTQNLFRVAAREFFVDVYRRKHIDIGRNR